MANQKTSEYSDVDLGIIATKGGYFDFSQITSIVISPPSIAYDSRRFDYFDLLDLFTNNIYNTDGQLTSIRTVDMNNLTLGFVKGRVGVGLNAPVATFHVEGNDTQAFRIDTVFGDSVLLINNAGEVSMTTKQIDISGDYLYFETGTNAEAYVADDLIDIRRNSNEVISSDGTHMLLKHNVLIDIDCPDVSLNQLTASTVPYLDSSKILRSSSIIPSELDCLSGATSPLQAQISALGSGVSAYKDPCLVATTGNITLSGEQTIDGVLTSSSRVLVWKQTDPKENGIYVSAAGAWTRATDFDNDADKIASSSVVAQDGSTYADREFICTTNEPVTFGSWNITFIEYGYAYVGGSTVTITGNVIDLNPSYIATLVTLTGTGTLTNKTLDGGTKISLGSDATYDMYYNGGSGVLTRLATGNTKVLTTDGSGVPTWATQGTAFNKDFGTSAGTACEGNDYRLGKDAAISGTNIDWTSATHFYKTLSASTTFTFSNNADSQTIIIKLIQGASAYTVTWPAAVKWTNGTEPTMSTGSGAIDVYTLAQVNGDILGSYVQNLS